MRYYVNKNAQPNGDHEVHAASCSFLPNEVNRTYLGDFGGCASAVPAAMILHPSQRLLLLRYCLPHGVAITSVDGIASQKRAG